MTTNDETTWDRDARACLAGLAAREDTTRAADARDAALIADATLALVRAVMPTLDGPHVAATIRMHANMHAPPGFVVDDVRGALACLVEDGLVERVQIDPDPVTALSMAPGQKLGAYAWKGPCGAPATGGTNG